MSAHGGHGKGRRPKPHEEEEHENHERWLVSYADMLTLLFVLFVVLFAISQVDKKKFEELKKGFGAEVSVIEGSNGALDDPATDPIKTDALENITPQAAGQVSAEALSAAERKLRSEQVAKAAAEAKKLEELEKKIDSELSKRGLTDTVKTRINERGLVVSIVTNRVIFEPSSADLAAGGRAVLETVAPVLKTVENPLVVEGHTNTVKARPKGWKNEWFLSTARASEVVTYLGSHEGVPWKRMEAAGLADTQPLYDPRVNPRADTLNRRVEIVILADALKPSATNVEKASESEIAAAEAGDAEAAAESTDSHATDSHATESTDSHA
ncbi:OmpA/MotB family protein, partial [Motilibacter aurantiacus]|uniref:OmpA/MotB family protein n=1 Tax=Motilibacter aurantiacus TaxID=2714955 RepID=UPI0014077773